jgi:hypothetical protein
MRDFAGGKEGRTEKLGRGVSFFLRFSLYQCTGELRASACGGASRTISIGIRPRGPRDAIYNVSRTGRTMHSTNTCHWGGTMLVDGLVFVEISQIQSQGLLCPLFLASAAVSARVTSNEADAGHVQSVFPISCCTMQCGSRYESPVALIPSSRSPRPMTHACIYRTS